MGASGLEHQYEYAEAERSYGFHDDDDNGHDANAAEIPCILINGTTVETTTIILLCNFLRLTSVQDLCVPGAGYGQKRLPIFGWEAAMVS